MRFETKPATVSHPQFLALIYHDIFSYPLKETELVFWQVGEEAEDARRLVEKTGPFYHLPGKASIIPKRPTAKTLSRPKWEIAKKAARVLQAIPTVKFVGVSGALAMNAAKAEDDIDLMIICQRNSLFATRLLAFLSLRFFNLRVRRAQDREIAGKLCLNLWLDEENLEFAKRQDIYTAHEILQVKTLVNKGNIHERFLVLNSWTRRFFPKAFEMRLRQSRKQKIAGYGEHFLGRLLALAEPPARISQLWYMRGRRTREEVGRGKALFHPLPWRELVLKTFEARLRSVARGKYPKVYTFPS